MKKMEQPLRDKLKALCWAMFAVFIALSLVSYHPADTTFRSFPANVPVKNLTGIVGAYIAEGLFFSLGWAAWAICALAFIWALSRFLGRSAPLFLTKMLGTSILLLALAALFGLGEGPGQEAYFAKSGLAGTVIAEFLLKYFGRAGSLIVLLSLGVLSAFVASEFLIWPLLRWTAKGAFNLVFNSKNWVKKLGFTARKQLSREEAPAAINRERPILKIEKSKPLAQGPFNLKLKKEKLKTNFIKPEPLKKQPKPVEVRVKTTSADYKLPTLDLLDSPPPIQEREIVDDLQENARILEATLRDFNVETKVTQVSPGPVITRYELEPAPGVKVHRIVELGDDIALVMKASSVRIVAPIPGKSRVGVEVPNSKSAIVYLKEILSSAQFQHSQSKLMLAIGKDISGQPVLTDLGELPHLLIAGTTGSGKTVCVNSIITSLLFNASYDELKFIMVDPKMVELAMFNNLPHLLCPVLTDPKKVSAALNWVVNEMEERYKLLAKAGARNIDLYNEKITSQAQQEPAEKMPYIVVIMDELADLMVVASQQVENAITRLAQLSRAVGIHLILATQRPSVDVITGVIKANFPARISFRVASKVDSRTVLDMNGADKLLGKGDLLFLQPGQHKPIRAQGSLIFDREIERMANFIKEQKPPAYNQELLDAQEKKTAIGKRFEKDELFDEAVKVILQTKQASVSMLQRRLGLGYTRAARLVDLMEEEGIVGPYRGSKAREILVDSDKYTQENQQDITE